LKKNVINVIVLSSVVSCVCWWRCTVHMMSRHTSCRWHFIWPMTT